MTGKKIRTGLTRHSFMLIGIIVLAALLRLLYLDRIPGTITSDELTYLLTIKAMVLTGHDLTGTWSPLSVFLFHYPPGQIQAELPFFLYFPVVAFLPFSLLSAHITNALISIAIVPLVYLIAKNLLGIRAGLAGSFLAAINPWSIYIGRTAYEVVPATFFFLLILYLLLILKKGYILLVIPVILLAFYSYIATKTVLVLFLGLAIFYVYFFKRRREDGIYYTVLLLFSVCITVIYIILITLHPASSRLHEILTPFSPSVGGQVDVLRKGSIQNFLDPLMINKFTVFGGILLAKLFNTLSFSYLFVSGDSFFSFWNHGLFYWEDALFLFLGMLYLFQKQKKIFLFFMAFIGIGIVPQLLHGVSSNNFTPHIALVFPFFFILAGYGVSCLLETLKNKKLYTLGISIIAVLYLLSLVGFMQNYFFQNSLQGKTAFSERILSRYIALTQTKHVPIEVYSPRLIDMFQKYLFYSDAYNMQTAGEVQKMYTLHTFRLGSVSFLPCDRNFKLRAGVVTLYDAECGTPNATSPTHAIKQLSDSGDSFLIYNDLLCGSYPLNNYAYGIPFSAFNVENLTPALFCKNFIFN